MQSKYDLHKVWNTNQYCSLTAILLWVQDEYWSNNINSLFTAKIISISIGRSVNVVEFRKGIAFAKFFAVIWVILFPTMCIYIFWYWHLSILTKKHKDIICSSFFPPTSNYIARHIYCRRDTHSTNWDTLIAKVDIDTHINSKNNLILSTFQLYSYCTCWSSASNT